MRFVCDQCKTKYSIDDARVHGKVLKIRCKTCSNVITVRDSAHAGAATKAKPAATAEKHPRTHTPAAAQRHTPAAVKQAAPHEGSRRTAVSHVEAPAKPATPPPPPPLADWYVSFDGEQEGPLPLEQAAERVRAETEAGKQAHAWRDGFEDWLPAAAVPELARLLPKPAARASTTRRKAGAKATEPVKPLVVSRVASPIEPQPQPAKAEAQPVATPAAVEAAPAAEPAPIEKAAPAQPAKAAPAAEEKKLDEAPVAAAPSSPAATAPESGPQLAIGTPASVGGVVADAVAPALQPASGGEGTAAASAQSASTDLIISETGIHRIPTEPPASTDLIISETGIHRIPTEPPASTDLIISETGIHRIPTEPPASTDLVISETGIHRIPTEPPASTDLVISETGIHRIPTETPASTDLVISETGIHVVPTRPPTAAQPSVVYLGAGTAPAPARWLKWFAVAAVGVIVLLAATLTYVLASGRLAPAGRSASEAKVAHAADDKAPAAPDPQGNPAGSQASPESKRNNNHTHAAPPLLKPAKTVAGAPAEPAAFPQFDRDDQLPRDSRLPSIPEREHAQSQVSETALRDVLQTNKLSLSQCYDRVLKHDDTLQKARIDVSVKVGISGMATKVTLTGSNNADLSTCLSQSIKRWHFPETGGEYQTTFPLLLQAGY